MKEKALARLQSLQAFDRGTLSGSASVLAGVDEAGRGPLAGPVVASAVIVVDDRFNLKIDDSKKLTINERENAFTQIMQKGIVSTAMVDCDRIDEINILQATLEAMCRAVGSLKAQIDLVLVDGPHPIRVPYPVRAIAGGDGVSLAIACASIIAKVMRDRVMMMYHERFPFYGFDKHKGYGTRDHLVALQKWGPCEIHRKSFRPVYEAVLTR